MVYRLLEDVEKDLSGRNAEQRFNKMITLRDGTQFFFSRIEEGNDLVRIIYPGDSVEVEKDKIQSVRVIQPGI